MSAADIRSLSTHTHAHILCVWPREWRMQLLRYIYARFKVSRTSTFLFNKHNTTRLETIKSPRERKVLVCNRETTVFRLTFEKYIAKLFLRNFKKINPSRQIDVYYFIHIISKRYTRTSESGWVLLSRLLISNFWIFFFSPKIFAFRIIFLNYFLN